MMKKIVAFALLLVLGVTTSNAQETSKAKKNIKAKTTAASTAKVSGAGMVFVSETIDYGTVAYNSDGNREFVFTNNGNKPLIITNAQGSCGCTVPSYSRAPIAPGARGVIGVHYDTSRAGQPFSKTITLTTNAVVPTKILTIKGNVLDINNSKS
ncbi:outer membrane lipoprotein-sorting protein [Flavobacterium sp. PL11]|jgi:outer membrane lipoprotein-sorting protein|nr:outer membrane lipoprotein-sorting protein [Flavobacterium sp. PL11]